jgi:hypothetical protein
MVDDFAAGDFAVGAALARNWRRTAQKAMKTGKVAGRDGMNFFMEFL